MVSEGSVNAKTGKSVGVVIGNLNTAMQKLEKTEKQLLSNPKHIQLIPCQQCEGCRLDYARSWAARCMLEAKFHESNWFVTLTYDPENVPTLNTISGELYRGGTTLIKDDKIIESLTLEPNDLKLFWHRLRKQITRDEKYERGMKERDKLPEDIEQRLKIRYYACGEYGSRTARPHYHAIIFNLNIPDLKVHTIKDGNPYYISEWLKKIWGHGNILISKVNWDTCAYVARYMQKKIKGKSAKDVYHKLGRVPEFSRMSNKGGIGQSYYENHKDEIYALDEIILANGQKIKPPRYYDKLYDLEKPEELDIIKTKRTDIASSKLAYDLHALQARGISYQDALAIQETAKRNRTKKLKRNLE